MTRRLNPPSCPTNQSHRTGPLTGHTAGGMGLAVSGAEAGARRKRYGSFLEVLFSRFCALQILLGTAISFAIPFALCYLSLQVAQVQPYPWYGEKLVGWVLGGVIIAPTATILTTPFGMPEAVQKGWVPVLRVEECPIMLRCLFPFLGIHPIWRPGVMRAIALGITHVLLIYVPIALVVASIYFMDVLLDTWSGIWFNTLYAVAITPPVTALAVLSCALEPNYERIERTMSTHPHPIVRARQRLVGCLWLFFSCRVDLAPPAFADAPDVEVGVAQRGSTKRLEGSSSAEKRQTSSTASPCSSPESGGGSTNVHPLSTRVGPPRMLAAATEEASPRAGLGIKAIIRGRMPASANSRSVVRL